MKLNSLFLWILYNLLKFASFSNIKGPANRKSLEERVQEGINLVYKRLLSEQSKEEISFRYFPPRYAENKGMFKSYIHVNWIDKTNSWVSTVGREYIKVTDMNGFVSSFVVSALLETYDLGTVEIDKNSIKMALDGMLNYRDKNHNDNVPLYNFWRQININGTWSQCPDTMNHIVKSFPDISNSTLNFLDYIGLKSIADLLRSFQGLTETFNYAYRIPPDADDTSVNMGVTGKLHKLKDIMKGYSDNWMNTNTDFRSLFAILKKYSYRPFLSYSIANGTFHNETSVYADLLDPRSYFPLRGYLDEKYLQAINNSTIPEVILPATWVYDLELQRKSLPLINMPLNVNNVDMNVAANFIYGITNLILFHENSTYINDIFDDTIKKMYLDTIDLFVWGLKTNIVLKRPDLSILYYPSVFDFYWLTSRTYNLLKTESTRIKNLRDNEFFDQVTEKLGKALKTYGTQQILSEVKSDGKYKYFAEFLGNYKNYTRNEDANFATSLAFNSLINIWTDLDDNKKIIYSPDAPGNIKNLVDEIANFLLDHINNYWSSNEGCFFSGSVKSFETFTAFYPANFFQYLNGTNAPTSHNDTSLFYDTTFTEGVRGYVQKEQYEKLLKEKWYGIDVPVDFLGFNIDRFPYWSSPAVTYSNGLIGLSKYKHLISKSNK